MNIIKTISSGGKMKYVFDKEDLIRFKKEHRNVPVKIYIEVIK